MRNSILVGAILAAIASMSWGAMFPVANHAFQYISPFYFTLIRYIPVAIILVILLYFIEGKKSFKLEGKIGRASCRDRKYINGNRIGVKTKREKSSDR